MEKLEFSDILKAVPKLSKAELRKLKYQIDFFLKGATITRETGTSASYLEDVILLYAKKYVHVPDKNTLWTNDPDKIATKLISIIIEIDKLVNKYKLDRKKTIKLVNLLIQCAVVKLKDMNVPKSFKTIVDRLVNPGSLIDECYPGYMNSKIFREFILNQ